MSQKKVKNMLNADEFPKNYEVNDQPSKTIPDEAMTVRQILDRYVNGMPFPAVDLKYNAQDDDDLSPLPNVNTLDFADQRALVSDIQEEIKQVQLKFEEVKKVTGDIPPDVPPAAAPPVAGGS